MILLRWLPVPILQTGHRLCRFFWSSGDSRKDRVKLYGKAFETILQWMKEFPLKNNRWGPFFEDVPGWSDTQMNAMTFARFIMEHREYFPDWKENAKSIINWVYKRLGNRTWEKYGVVVINEQTAYEIPGNSHTASQGADELLYHGCQAIAAGMRML